MIGAVIGFVLENLPAILLVMAIVAGLVSRRRPRSEALLSWLLLLPIGVTGIWAAIYHLAFPKFAAAFIGWQPSPFQFEVGVADLAFGVTACVAFWCSLPFKAAITCVSAVALLGDAVEHVHQMLIAGNFAPGDAGGGVDERYSATASTVVFCSSCNRRQMKWERCTRSPIRKNPGQSLL